MKLCTVKFIEGSTDKEYTFKIPRLPEVRKGDILRNIAYGNDPMEVIKVFDYPAGDYYNGFLLKDLSPTETTVEFSIQREKDEKNNKIENMETELRSIKISLKQARDWYKGDNSTLRKLALQTYTEEELNDPQSLKEILDSLGIEKLNLNMQMECKQPAKAIKFTKNMVTNLTLQMHLTLLAKYFNGSWEPEMQGFKYFLARAYNCVPLSYIKFNLGNGFYVGAHERVIYPGVVYFKNENDVRKVYEMLKDELK